jgi:hypothetical protein
MSMTYPRFTTQIAGPPEVVFDLVADMPNYGRWLPGSDAFGGTVNVTPYPVRLGTASTLHQSRNPGPLRSMIVQRTSASITPWC